MFLFVVLLVTVYGAYLLKQYFSVWQFSEQFPGKKTLPLIGNGHQIGNTTYDFLQNLFTWTKEYKFSAFRAWLGPQLFVIITNPQDVEQVLSSNKHLKKFQDYRFLHDWIGNGLVTSSGNFWFRQRKLITPSFHFKILNEFHLVMNKGVNTFITKLNKFADKDEAFDAQHIVNLATLDVICESAMGVEVNALDDPESPLVGAFHDISIVVYKRMFSAWKRFDLLFPFSKEYKVHKRAQHILHSFNREVIQKRKQLLVEFAKTSADPSQSDDSPKQKRAFLDTLLSTSVNGIPLTDTEISDEVSTFVFAGHDTTASAISFGLYHLSIYPKEQQKVYEEQLTIFANDMSRDSTYQDLQEMKYLEVFIKESQRLIPAVSFIGREAQENTQLADGKIIPTGASIGILLFAMGHNPEVFAKPEVFDPERFFPDARSNTNPYEYVPFSAGPRNCIGQRFALLEIRTVLAKLVRHFEILPPKTPFEPMLAATATTMSNNGVYIRLKRRI